MNEVKTVAITTWGNPWKAYSHEDPAYRWNEVEYVLEGKREKSRTTLPLIQKVYNPSESIILVQESVIFESVAKYSEVKASVERIFRDFIGKIEKASGVKLSNAKVFVTPAVGSFKNSLKVGNAEKNLDIEVCGTMRDFFSTAYYTIAEELLSISSKLAKNSREEPLLIILDLTHGINYTPVLTYEAVRMVAGLLAWFMPVEIKVLNSEPVISDQEAKDFRIHVVESRRVKPATEIIGLGHGRFLKLNEKCAEKQEGKNIGEDIYKGLKDLEDKFKVNKERLNAFLGSFVNGIPLPAVVFQPDWHDLKCFLEGVVKLFDNWSAVYLEGENHIKIIHKASYRWDFIAAASAWVLSEMLSIKGFQKKDYLTLTEVKELTGEVFGRNEKFKAMISRDIGEIEKVLSKGSGSASPSLLYRFFEESYEDCLIELLNLGKRYIFERNFLAHSGFEKCVTVVEPCDEKEDSKLGYADLMKPLSEVDPDLAKGLSAKVLVDELVKKALQVGLNYIDDTD